MKVLIADDHALFRDGLSLHLEQIDPEVIIFQACTFSQAFKIIDDEKKLDLIILDLDMPDMPWDTAIKEMRQKAQGARFVVISAGEDCKSVRKAMETGISGYIPKRSDPKVLLNALKLIIEGGSYLPPSILESSICSPCPIDCSQITPKGKMLTNRQNEVLGYVAQGMSNKQIAYEMGVSEATVKLHINALLRSIGVNNRTQAVVTAQKMGLI